jgi:Rod binding domain-containing protein
MNISAITPSTAADLTSPAKIRDAGRQFEALLIGQILHSAHESGTGWLGTPEDSSSDCATDYAEQQFAETMAHSGGFGIANMIAQGLRQAPKEPATLPEHSPPVPGFRHRDKSPGSTSPVPKSREP